MAEYVLHVHVADEDAPRFEEELMESVDDEAFVSLRTDRRRFDVSVESFGREDG